MPLEAGTLLLVVGRVLLGALFVMGGVRHAFVYPAVIPMMEKRGVPAPGLVLAAGSLFEFAAGLALMLGAFVFWAALGLAVFTVAATVMLLDFWSMSGPEREGAMSGALSNVAIIGGLLIAAGTAV